MKKCKIGTATTLLVPATKSAEASITSTANLIDLNPQKMQQRKISDNNPKMINPAINHF